ncbi:MAG: hypothetical protein ACP5N1_07050 [Candidatus Woesearchaeota archaeon]
MIKDYSKKSLIATISIIIALILSLLIMEINSGNRHYYLSYGIQITIIVLMCITLISSFIFGILGLLEIKKNPQLKGKYSSISAIIVASLITTIIFLFLYT